MPNQTTSATTGSYRTLIASMLKVGFIGFGGGSALIPVIEHEVHRHRLADTRTFTQYTVAASVTPGALPVKLAALLGWQRSACGALMSALAMALPGTLGTLLLLASIQAQGSQFITYVEYASVGITAFIIALLLHYIVSVMRSAQSLVSALVIMCLVAGLTGAAGIVNAGAALFGIPLDVSWPRLSSLQVIVLALGIMLLMALVKTKSTRPRASRADFQENTNGGVNYRTALLRLCVVSAAIIGGAMVCAYVCGGVQAIYFLGLIALSTLVSFGGGEAYVAVADGLFVADGWVSAEAYYGQIVPIANALPGPILIKVAAGMALVRDLGVVGWVMAGMVLVVTAVLCALVSASVVAVLNARPQSVFLSYLSAHILPVVCGLLVTTCASMLNSSAGLIRAHAVPVAPALWCMGVGIAAMYALRYRGKMNDIVLIVLAGGVALLALAR